MTDNASSGHEDGQSPLLRDNRKDAVISDCGLYRYRLTRTWDDSKPTVAVIMLNPSTADATEDDPTIRRVLDYAKQWGYGTLAVGNLFALRTSDPNNIYKHESPVGPKNDEYLQKIVDEAEMVVVAWGTGGSIQCREQKVADLLDVDFYALDTTKDGHPNHPLYQPKDAEPTLWELNNGN